MAMRKLWHYIMTKVSNNTRGGS